MGCEYEAESFALIESKDPANWKRHLRGNCGRSIAICCRWPVTLGSWGPQRADCAHWGES